MPYCGLTKAANKLPESCREAFRRAFRAANCMDLYDGELKSYFEVIAHTLEDKTTRLEKMKTQINISSERIKKILDGTYIDVEELRNEDES